MVDSRGILHPEREDIDKMMIENPWKYKYAIETNAERRKGGIPEAMPLLDYAKGRKVGLALFRDLYPLSVDGWAQRLNEAKEVVAVELNYRGQFAEYLASKGVKVTRRVLKWWGEPFSIDELGEWL